MITQDELKRLFHYDENTGLFTRLVKTSHNTHIGDIAGYIDVYNTITINGKQYKAHRLVWLYVYGNFPINQIDHINGVHTDNRIANLRECTNAENNRNKSIRSDNTSGYNGVTFIYCKWRARCKINGVDIIIGYYNSAIEASVAYQDYTKLHYGEFYNGI